MAGLSPALRTVRQGTRTQQSHKGLYPGEMTRVVNVGLSDVERYLAPEVKRRRTGRSNHMPATVHAAIVQQLLWCGRLIFKQR